MFGSDHIRLYWVAGHSRILGNGTADTLARLGSFARGGLLVGPDTPIFHLCGSHRGMGQRGRVETLGERIGVMFLNVYGLL